MTTTVARAAPSGGSGTSSSRLEWTALTALAPTIWGTTYLVTTHLLPPGHPLFAALARALPAGLIALALTRRLPHGSWWWKSLVLGTLNMAAFFPLLFVSAQHLPGGVAATLGATQPILVAVLAVVLLSERLSVWRVGWGVVGVIGVALVVLGPGAALSVTGLAAGLAGAAAMSVGVVLTKRWGRPPGVSALGLAGWQLTAAGAVLFVPALLVDGVPAGVDVPAVGGYLWLSLFGALLTYSIWFAGIRRLPVTSTALLGLLSPLTAAVLGAIIAGERLTVVAVVGFVTALAALAAGQLPAPRAGRTNGPRRGPRATGSCHRYRRQRGLGTEGCAEASSPTPNKTG